VTIAAPFTAFAALAVTALAGCIAPDAGRVGTREQRLALFDTIVARVERRDAFSEIKNSNLGYHPIEAMRAHRDDVAAAASEQELFYALERLSNARRDRHLSIALVPGGIQLSDSAGVDIRDGGEAGPPQVASVRVFPDYSDVGGYFVGDVVAGMDGPAPGDRVVAVNGVSTAEWERNVNPYIRHSSVAGLRWRVAEMMTLRSAVLPPALRPDSLVQEVERPDGSRAVHRLPRRSPDGLQWQRISEPVYHGLVLERRTPTWDLLLPADGSRFLVVVWSGFRETMVADVDSLVVFASRRNLLDHAVIMDVTRSRGGSLGPYALQHLQPKAFRTTFGTLRLSDVIMPFIESKRRDFAARNINDGGVPETIDDGSWLMDWLETDVLAALETDAIHTRPVPFKLAHAPRDSDGVLPPASVHFRGPFAVISGPSGGSHLDQFNAIVKDNGLGPIIGMPAGGYSNTWEWEELLTFPGTDRPVIGFMYDIGHTIRPNGEVLEGNPALADEWIPLTADGVTTYYARLLEAARRRVGR
jgi:hypothetical protein